MVQLLSIFRFLAMVMLIMFSASSIVNAEEVDLELVLAMDASGSISEREYLLQLEGTAAAFRDPAVIQAIKSGPNGKIAVALMLWSDAAYPKERSDWYVLDGPEAAFGFANMTETFHINPGQSLDVGGGGTGIGSGVQEALSMIRSNGYEGLRKVVDVSGDGIETEFWFSKGIMIRDARILAQNQNVTINGLPILGPNFPDLDDYYRNEVISGPGAFIVTAKSFVDFGNAIKQKLLREISSNVAKFDDNSAIEFALNSQAEGMINSKQAPLLSEGL